MKRTWIKAAVIALVGVAALAVAVILLNNNDNAYYQQKRGTMSEGFGELKTIEWQGDTYREKPAVTTILLVGIDKANALENVDTNEYRRGGQADFLMLIAIDKTDKKIHRLQIDRDTMTDIRIVGAFGTDAGTRVSQICLSHGYGATPEENAANTMWAVQNLMGDLEIDGYYAINMDDIGAFNNAIGGVMVTIDGDLTAVDPEFTDGAEVLLSDEQAEKFLRARMSVGEGTNQERMSRQLQYMQAAYGRLINQLRENPAYINDLYAEVQDKVETDRSAKQLSEFAKYIGKSESLGFLQITGEVKEGDTLKDGVQHAEFYPDEKSLIGALAQVITFY